MRNLDDCISEKLVKCTGWAMSKAQIENSILNTSYVKSQCHSHSSDVGRIDEIVDGPHLSSYTFSSQNQKRQNPGTLFRFVIDKATGQGKQPYLLDLLHHHLKEQIKLQVIHD